VTNPAVLFDSNSEPAPPHPESGYRGLAEPDEIPHLLLGSRTVRQLVRVEMFWVAQDVAPGAQQSVTVREPSPGHQFTEQGRTSSRLPDREAGLAERDDHPAFGAALTPRRSASEPGSRNLPITKMPPPIRRHPRVLLLPALTVRTRAGRLDPGVKVC
jgi:hypothetical protein